MGRLVSVWGTCDGVEILFDEISEDVWATNVPADLSDGQYIVEVWGCTHTGFLIYTTAVLYLCDSRCVFLKFMPDDLFIKIKMNDYHVMAKEEQVSVKYGKYMVNVWERFKEKVVVKCV